MQCQLAGKAHVRIAGASLRSPLHGSSSSDDQLDDFPLRETDEPRSERRPVVDPPLFATAVEEEAPRRRGGFGVWLAAAVALVIGIVIGFASGYRAGKNVAAEAAVVGQPAPPPAPTPKGPGQTFSESAVSEPGRVDQKPAPAAAAPPPPKPAAVAPAPAAPKANLPRSAPPSTRSAPQSRPAATERPQTTKPVPSTATPAPAAAKPAAAAAEPVAPAPTGPGSIEVVSRPAGANVVLDGKVVGRTPMTIEIGSGRHTVRLDLPGYQQWQTVVDVRPGTPTRVAASLEQ